MGVEIVDTVEELLAKVDVVLLTSGDGRPHLRQVRPVFAAGKPVYIDKPLAGSLSDAVEMVLSGWKLPAIGSNTAPPRRMSGCGSAATTNPEMTHARPTTTAN